MLNVLSLSLVPSPSADGSMEDLSGFGLLLPVYQLNSFIKFWKPPSPKKSKEPGDEFWEVPRWMRSSTSRTTNSSGTSRFQPAARMLYHLALSEHSWASCRFPCVFWSLACTDAFKDTGWWDKQVSWLHDNSIPYSLWYLFQTITKKIPCATSNMCPHIFLKGHAWVFPEHSLISHEHLPKNKTPITLFFSSQKSSLSIILDQYWTHDSLLRPFVKQTWLKGHPALPRWPSEYIFFVFKVTQLGNYLCILEDQS